MSLTLSSQQPCQEGLVLALLRSEEIEAQGGEPSHLLKVTKAISGQGRVETQLVWILNLLSSALLHNFLFVSAMLHGSVSAG